jgi:beta-phosphoglucomutase
MTGWPAAIFFDFDGVIVNSEPIHFQAFKEVLAEEQIDITEKEYFSELIGFDDRGVFRHVLKKHGRPLDAKELSRIATRKGDVTRDMIVNRRYSALPGVEKLVRGLARHYPLAICSGALREEIESMLDGVNLRECFPTIVAAEDVSIGKPNPMGYMLAARLVSERTGMPLAPKDCLVIEDAPTVIESVRKAGFVTLGVATSYPLEDLRGANYAVTRLEPAEVLKLIPQLKVGLDGATA